MLGLSELAFAAATAASTSVRVDYTDNSRTLSAVAEVDLFLVTKASYTPVARCMYYYHQRHDY